MSNSMTTISNGVKLAGEALLPGASLLMDGNFKGGAAHAVIGVGARAIFGPFAAVIVAADSFSRSVSNRYLWEHLPRISGKDEGPAVEVADVEKETKATEKDAAKSKAKA